MTQTKDLYININSLPIDKLHEHRLLMFVHNCLNNASGMPIVFTNYFELSCLSYNYTCRNTYNLSICRFRTNLGQRSTTYKAAKLWNDLPNNIKSIKSFKLFKSKTKQWMLCRLQ